MLFYIAPFQILIKCDLTVNPDLHLWSTTFIQLKKPRNGKVPYWLRVYTGQGATSRWLHNGKGRGNPLERSSRSGATRRGPSCDCELSVPFVCPWPSSLFCDFLTFVLTFLCAISDDKINALRQSSVVENICTFPSLNPWWGGRDYVSKYGKPSH
jgi:hypothetical protein